MNVTKDVINDLYPLYVEKECSADTRALVEEYLQRNPQHAEELCRVMSAPLPGAPAAGAEAGAGEQLPALPCDEGEAAQSALDHGGDYAVRADVRLRDSAFDVGTGRRRRRARACR